MITEEAVMVGIRRGVRITHNPTLPDLHNDDTPRLRSALQLEVCTIIPSQRGDHVSVVNSVGTLEFSNGEGLRATINDQAHPRSGQVREEPNGHKACQPK